MIPKMIMNILLGWRPSEILEGRGDVSGHMINKHMYSYDIYLFNLYDIETVECMHMYVFDSN